MLWSQPEVRLALLATVVAAITVAVRTARRDRPWVAPCGLTLSFGLILAATLSGIVGQPGGGIAWWSQCRLEGPAQLLDGLGTRDGLANVALFVPLGLFATLVNGKVRAGMAAGSALSVLVELIQGFASGRDCYSGDVLANVAGVALGAVVARAAALLWKRRAVPVGRECTTR